MANGVQITVIVVTYNSKWSNLKKTLRSILLQRSIELQIIIADDGSKENLFANVKDIFRNYNFTRYQLIPSNQNMGICNNVNRAANEAIGKYTKLISPGDCLYNELTLSAWYYFMEKNELKFSFGDAVYYSDDSAGLNIHKRYHNPINAAAYKLGRRRNAVIKLNYLVLNDHALGAAVLTATDIMKEYSELIANRVIYAEDSMYRIMVFDDTKMDYYQHPVLWYEWGTGISTTGSEKWGIILKNDFKEANRIMLNRKKVIDFFSLRYDTLLRIKCRNATINRITKAILFPASLFWGIRKRLFPTYSLTDINTRFYTLISSEN